MQARKARARMIRMVTWRGDKRWSAIKSEDVVYLCETGLGFGEMSVKINSKWLVTEVSGSSR